MKRIAIDFDLTMGVPFRDVDDGLALLYVLGSEQLSLEMVTTTFGNSTLDTVRRTTERTFDELCIRGQIPLFHGADKPDDPVSDAARAMVDLVNRSPGEITFLGLGSLTNFSGARLLDPDFFTKVKEIVLMGGITEPLIIGRKEMKELNFSSDPTAAHTVLSSEAPVTVITGHLCLQALFTREMYEQMGDLATSDRARENFDYIRRKTDPWLSYIGSLYENNGFHNWDAVAALYLDSPEMFEPGRIAYSGTIDSLKRGMIIGDGPVSKELSVPERIVDVDAFNRKLIDRWGKA